MAFTVVEVEMPETLDKHWEFSIKGGASGDQYVANIGFSCRRGRPQGIRYVAHRRTLQKRN